MSIVTQGYGAGEGGSGPGGSQSRRYFRSFWVIDRAVPSLIDGAWGIVRPWIIPIESEWAMIPNPGIRLKDMAWAIQPGNFGSATLLVDIQTILRSSVKTVLGSLDNKLIAIGRGKTYAHPSLQITVENYDYSRRNERVTARIRIVTSGRNLDETQILDTITLSSEVMDELLAPTNRKTPSYWFIINDLKIKFMPDSVDPKLLICDIFANYQFSESYQ